MKNWFFKTALVLLCLCLFIPASIAKSGYSYPVGGQVYTNTTVPIIVPKEGRHYSGFKKVSYAKTHGIDLSRFKLSVTKTAMEENTNMLIK